MDKNNNDFFPNSDYQMPISSNYMKFVEGENNFRVLSSTIVGYEYWDKNNKPIRSREPFDETPNIKTDKDGNPTRVNHFWAFVVWNYEAKKVQILELTQKSVMGVINSLVKNSKWGNPQGYDITVSRSGSGLDTEYSIVPSPHSPLTDQIKIAWEHVKINLNALYSGNDPFQAEKGKEGAF